MPELLFVGIVTYVISTLFCIVYAIRDWRQHPPITKEDKRVYFIIPFVPVLNTGLALIITLNLILDELDYVRNSNKQ